LHCQAVDVLEVPTEPQKQSNSIFCCRTHPSDARPDDYVDVRRLRHYNACSRSRGIVLECADETVESLVFEPHPNGRGSIAYGLAGPACCKAIAPWKEMDEAFGVCPQLLFESFVLSPNALRQPFSFQYFFHS